MAVDVFLQLGDVRGESMAMGWQGAMDVLSWHWVGAGASVVPPGADRPAQLSITRLIDAASPMVCALHRSGAPADAVLAVLRVPHAHGFVLRITLRAARVVDLQWSGTVDADQPMETLVLEAGAMKVEAQRIDARGDPQDISEYGWGPTPG